MPAILLFPLAAIVDLFGTWLISPLPPRGTGGDWHFSSDSLLGLIVFGDPIFAYFKLY